MDLVAVIRHGISVAMRPVQRKRQREFYGGFLRTGQLVFDVGANVGDRSAVFLALGAKVIAVEPQQACVEALRARFQERVVVIAQGLAEAPGVRKMALADVDTVSTMEPEWVSSMTASQRFGEMKWSEPVDVTVTTLDRLIEEHGVPAFIKVDVEGFESGVLAGLTQAVPLISFEFVAERPGATAACAQRLASLGMTEFNFSEGESMSFASEQWMDSDALLGQMSALGEAGAWGDVYARPSLRRASHSSE